jgi:glutamine amidotransferase
MKYDIAIVDYGVGNLHSALNACKQFTDRVIVTDDIGTIREARGLILPGVGSFEAGMQGLRVRNLEGAIKEFALEGKPILGICLGAQLLLSRGYEFGEWEGLGLIEGEVKKFPEGKTPRLPHIGWNSMYGFKSDVSILSGITEGSEVYFVHSFILKPQDEAHVAAWSKYGDVEFPSVIRKGNLFGCQFHPEKSSTAGMHIIKNFVNLSKQ